jgi:hypothetical protein
VPDLHRPLREAIRRGQRSWSELARAIADRTTLSVISPLVVVAARLIHVELRLKGLAVGVSRPRGEDRRPLGFGRDQVPLRQVRIRFPYGHRPRRGDVESAPDADDHHQRVALERRRGHVRMSVAAPAMVAAGEDRVREDAVDLQPRCELRRHLAACHPRPHGSDRVLERAAAVRPELAHAIRLAGGQPHAQLL